MFKISKLSQCKWIFFRNYKISEISQFSTFLDVKIFIILEHINFQNLKKISTIKNFHNSHNLKNSQYCEKFKIITLQVDFFFKLQNIRNFTIFNIVKRKKLRNFRISKFLKFS